MEDSTLYCNALQTLSKAGLHKTSQRLSVLDLLIHHHSPLNAGDICSLLSDTCKINKVTVYRILKTFKRHGIVREIETQQGVNYYEIDCLHNPAHAHFNCRRCGILICLSPMTLSLFQEGLPGCNHLVIDQITVNVSGLCDACRSQLDDSVS